MASDLIGNPAAAREEIADILDMISEIEEEYPRIWDRGEGYLTSVRASLQGVDATIANRHDVSERQATAIENWAAGVANWHPDHKS